jgi:hypothetical protein
VVWFPWPAPSAAPARPVDAVNDAAAIAHADVKADDCDRDGKTGCALPPGPGPPGHLPCSVANHVLVTVRTPAHGAVIEAVVDQDVGVPVPAAVVQPAVWAVEGRQFPADLPQRERSGFPVSMRACTASSAPALAECQAAPRPAKPLPGIRSSIALRPPSDWVPRVHLGASHHSVLQPSAHGL